MTGPAGACAACLRRAWLLDELAGPLDYLCRDPQRLLEVLALDDAALIDALAGTRRGQVRAAYQAVSAAPAAPASRQLAARVEQTLCRHRASFPHRLRFACAPHALAVAPSARRLCELARGPVVAILGSARASDYGIEVALALARGAAMSGVAVASAPQPGICAAALRAALEAGGAVLCVTAGGLNATPRSRARGLGKRVGERGCLLAELPHDSRPRRWCETARRRLIAGLAQVTVVVEAADSERDLLPARFARSLGRFVGAVPGQVTSTLSAGPHRLLAEGAALVRGPGDVLALLGEPQPTSRGDKRGATSLDPRLQRVLEAASSGDDALEALIAGGQQVAAVLHALSELELMGLVARGDGGRYVARAGIGNAPAGAGRR